MRGLDRLAAEVLDRRLLRNHSRPVAVALSGGGDSLALLRVAAGWARANGRSLIALTVDHGLNPQSPAWTQLCADRAARAGAGFRALHWAGEKPATGVPAAARAARHRLLADAARTLGARVILVGHTADDVLESRTMRARGSTTPEPVEWSPSPAWPEGRGLFIARPLLGLRRAALRAWLAEQGETWIDDPANTDTRFARAQARAEPVPTEPPAAPAAIAELAARVEGDADTGFVLTRAMATTPRLLGVACLCAGGGDRPPERERLRRLAARIGVGEIFTAALCGARVEAGDKVRIYREAGEAGRGGLEPLTLAAGDAAVWDGRYEVASDAPAEVRALAGLSKRLSEAERGRLAAYAPAARRALPVLLVGDEVRLAKARPLAGERLRAAAGLVRREPD